MAKLTLTDLANLSNESTVVTAINANNTSIETALENTLSRDGTSPNQMGASLDMNSNTILNLPDALTDQEPVTLGQLNDTVAALEAGAVVAASYVTLAVNATLTSERVLTAGTNISITDAGAGSTVTVAISDSELNAIAGLTSAADKVPYFTGAGTADVTTLSAFGRTVIDDTDASTARTTLGVVIGTDVQAYDADLAALAANSTDGFWVHTGAGTGAARTLTAPAEGITVTNPAGVAGNPTLVLANDLAAVEGLSSTGIARRTGSDAWSVGTLVSNAELATAGAATLKGNPTNATAAVTDFTIQGLTARGSPDVTNDKLPIYDNASGTLKYITPTELAGASSGTVTSVTGDGLVITTSGTLPPRFGFANASLAVSAAASALTIALKDNAGSDPSATSPATFIFRNATGTTGSWSQVSATGAMSLVLSSGSTLGVTSSTAFRLWVVMFNDAGTLRLGVINCAVSGGVFGLTEGIPASSTAEGGAGAADSAGVFYTSTAVTSKSYLILGYIEWSASGLTAGTWTTTNLNYIQTFGPGINKPGDVVQRKFATTSTATNTTSATFVTTNVTANIALTSAANYVEGRANADLYASVTNTSAIGSVHRDATDLNVQVTAWAGSSPVIAAAVWVFTDSPNSTSTIAYNVRLRTASAGNSVSINIATGGVSYGTMQLEEIMR